MSFHSKKPSIICSSKIQVVAKGELGVKNISF